MDIINHYLGRILVKVKMKSFDPKSYINLHVVKLITTISLLEDIKLVLRCQ